MSVRLASLVYSEFKGSQSYTVNKTENQTRIKKEGRIKEVGGYRAGGVDREWLHLMGKELERWKLCSGSISAGSLRAFLGTHMVQTQPFFPLPKSHSKSLLKQIREAQVPPGEPRGARVALGNGAALSIPICSPPATSPFPGRDREADQRTSDLLLAREVVRQILVSLPCDSVGPHTCQAPVQAL